eukprot:GHVS01009903.1.p1 GENE.GHVS01009903.1~~GHVS01009903.1.p1  ORF type:complete len:497 (-),score=128.99 GHVS01009903.1:216-1706(-)
MSSSPTRAVGLLPPPHPNPTKKKKSCLYKVHHLLLSQSKSPNGCNIVFSPHNLDTALAMLLYGLAGQSALQLQNFYFEQQQEEPLKAVVEALHLDLLPLPQSSSSSKDDDQDEEEEPHHLHRATRVVFDKSVGSVESFAARLMEDFHATATSADFQESPNDVRQLLNRWVQEQTRNNIPELLPPGAINSMSRLVLVAALYFKSRWRTPFKLLTECGVFHALSTAGGGGQSNLDNSSSRFSKTNNVVVRQTGVRYMEVKATARRGFGYFRYEENNTTTTTTSGSEVQGSNDNNNNMRQLSGLGCELIEVPYTSGDMSMVIVMPDDPMKLPMYEKQWAEEEVVEDWIDKLRSENLLLLTAQECTFTLPSFRFTPQTTHRSAMDIRQVLTDLGVTDIFCPHKCDLSNIGAAATGDGGGGVNLFVSGIFHKCVVEVDEMGTEASAATGVVAQLMCVMPPGLTVRVDRPFLFQIRMKVPNKQSKDDLVLFMGRVADINAVQ